MKHKTKIAVAGVGFVGGVLSRYFEEVRGFVRGRNLFLYDTDPRKNFGDDINRADVIFVCVPTPRSRYGGGADLTAVESVFRQIGGNKIVVIKSTVPPGTTEYFQKKSPRHKIMFNPEFLTEARAWDNMTSPDRQLVGWTEKSRDASPEVLNLLPPAPLFSPSAELDLSATEAEIAKYAANAFLARKVTFANAVFDLARHHAANYENVRLAVAADKRIGPSHLDVHHQGYRGYGGYCFVKDTEALIAHCRENGLGDSADLFAADRDFNDKILGGQGLTAEDVSVHHEERIREKIKKVKNNNAEEI